jgi:hypothetical protein
VSEGDNDADDADADWSDAQVSDMDEEEAGDAFSPGAADQNSGGGDKLQKRKASGDMAISAKKAKSNGAYRGGPTSTHAHQFYGVPLCLPEPLGESAHCCDVRLDGPSTPPGVLVIQESNSCLCGSDAGWLTSLIQWSHVCSEVGESGLRQY